MAREPGSWRILARHFWTRFFEAEATSPHSEPTANVVQALGLLAAPGMFFMLLCQTFIIQGWDLISVRYWFVSFSMLVMAFLMVLEWDALFPDRRDFLILGSLPVRPSTVFFAKAAALAAFLGMFLLDVNLLSTFFWPGIDVSSPWYRIMLLHFAIEIVAGLFAALSIAAIKGLLVALAPERAYRRISVMGQTLLMCLLVMLLALTPILSNLLRKFAHDGSPYAFYFPPYWFVGLYEYFSPAMAQPYVLDLGKRAPWGIAAALGIFIITYVPGYRLHVRKTVDLPSCNLGGPGLLYRTLSRASNLWLLRSPAQRGVFHFITQTITRSVKHRIFLATYGGFGAALALAGFTSEHDGLLRLPLNLAFISMTGLRAAFNFPAELSANWAFQAAETAPIGEYLSGMRKWIVTCAILPLFLLLSIMEFTFFPWRVALLHIAFGIALSVLLMDVLFFGFRKVPFTCARYPGKINMAALSAAYVLGLIYFGSIARIEVRLARWPIGTSVVFTFIMVLRALAGNFSRSHLAQAAVLDYEDAGDPAVRTLDIIA